jgi:hypothetical protein
MHATVVLRKSDATMTERYHVLEQYLQPQTGRIEKNIQLVSQVTAGLGVGT